MAPRSIVTTPKSSPNADWENTAEPFPIVVQAVMPFAQSMRPPSTAPNSSRPKPATATYSRIDPWPLITRSSVTATVQARTLGDESSLSPAASGRIVTPGSLLASASQLVAPEPATLSTKLNGELPEPPPR